MAITAEKIYCEKCVLLFTYSIVVSSYSSSARTMADLPLVKTVDGRWRLRPSSKAVKFKLVLSHDRPCSRFTRCWIPTSIPPVMHMNGDSMHLGGYAPVDLIKRTPAGRELIQRYGRSFVIHEGRSSQRARLEFYRSTQKRRPLQIEWVVSRLDGLSVLASDIETPPLCQR